MAQKPGIAIPLYVVDTSYLTELFGVPGFSDQESTREVRRRFEEAFRRDYRLFVPIPCLLELADHISDVPDGNRRRQLANKLLESVALSMVKGKPWNVTPAGALDDFLRQFRQAFEAFARRYVSQRGLGLTDAFSAQEAKRLKAKFAGLNYRVHIWTKDRGLKRLEPDDEEDPFVA
jgi:hypothetical protein